MCRVSNVSALVASLLNGPLVVLMKCKLDWMNVYIALSIGHVMVFKQEMNELYYVGLCYIWWNAFFYFINSFIWLTFYLTLMQLRWYKIARIHYHQIKKIGPIFRIKKATRQNIFSCVLTKQFRIATIWVWVSS